MLKTKSVTSPVERKHDGLRILAARYRGRRLPADRYDVWMPSLGPSERLLRAFQSGRVSWPAFARRYRAELIAGGAIDRSNPRIKNHGQKFTLRLIRTLAEAGHVTLMCHCAEDETQCHRHLLRAMVESQ